MELMNVHALAGHIIRRAAYLLHLLRSEFRDREPIAFGIDFYSQFPKPCPCTNTCPSLGCSRCHGLFKAFSKQYYNDNTLKNENNWNASKAFAAGGEHRFLCSLSSRRCRLPPTFQIDNPEYGPGTIIDGKDVSTSSAIASGVSTSSASESSSSTGTPSSISIMPGATGTPPKGNTSNAGAIAAGAMGGIATISIIFVAIFYLRRTRRRLQAASADLGSFPPMQNDEVVAQSPLGTPLTMRFYVRLFNVPRRCDYVSSCAISLLFPYT
jgi:hypothetical protein